MKSSFFASWPAIWLPLSEYRSPAELNRYANAGKKDMLATDVESADK